MKGNIAEAAILHALVERDFAVLVPFGEGQPYDLVVHIRGDVFLRVQCKSSRAHNGCIMFNSRSTDHGHGQGTYVGVADLFGVYFPPTRAVYLVPVLDSPTSTVTLRLAPTRNNQQLGVRQAADFEIDQWTIDALSGLETVAHSSGGRHRVSAAA